MTKKSNVNLLFFRAWPDTIESRAPLLSALQKIDTSFLMVSQHRFPDAFTTFVSALESALKAGLNTSTEKRADFKTLLDAAHKMHPNFTSIDSSQTRLLRDTRNTFEHFGFSPKDDSQSARLLLEIGVQLLDDWLSQAFALPLLDRSEKNGCLDWETGKHLRYSMRFFAKQAKEHEANFTHSVYTLGHSIRWRCRHSYMSDWESELANDWSAQADLSHHKKEQLQRLWLDHWNFDCPVCGEYEAFVCKLGDLCEDLQLEDIVIKEGLCVNCDFTLSPALSWMAQDLCSDQFEDALRGLTNA